VREWERWAAGTGVAYVVFAVVGFFFVPDPPQPTTSNEGLLAYFSTKTEELSFQVFFFALAGISFLWFIGTLAGALRRAEDAPTGLAAIAVTAGATANAVFLGGMVCWSALAASADTILDQGVARGLYDLGRYAYTLSGVPAAAFVLAVSLGTLRTRFLPVAVGWAGLLLALVLVLDVAAATIGDDDDFGPTGSYGVITFLLFLAWVFVTSLFLMQRVAPRRRVAET
jgi:Domain of unknown function (DUF4386)